MYLRDFFLLYKYVNIINTRVVQIINFLYLDNNCDLTFIIQTFLNYFRLSPLLPYYINPCLKIFINNSPSEQIQSITYLILNISIVNFYIVNI